MKRLALGVLLALGVGAMCPALALAHPLGNFTVNRYSRLEVDPDRVTLRYVLDLAEIPTLQELGAAGIDGDPDASQRASLLRRFAAQLRDGARLTIGGEAVRWDERDRTLEMLPGQAGLSTMRVALTFLTSARAADGGAIEYRDANFPDRIGWREIVLRAGPGVRLEDATAPSEDESDELRRYPSDPTRPPLAVSDASARIRLGAAADALPQRPVVDGASRVGVDPIADHVTDLLRGGAAGDPIATLLALAAAAGIGAAHAVTPGHGKTVMAAYLIGTRGTRRAAVALGGLVALSHTVGVLGLAAMILGASTAVAPERFYPYASALSALTVVGIGVWLVRGVLRRTRAQEHTHDHGDGHVHAHGRAHGHDTAGVVGWRTIVALGVSGGIVPSASALLLLLAAVSLRRADLGLILIIAFGAGMAVVLVGIGLALVGAGQIVGGRLREIPVVRRVAALLPAATAVTVLLVGTGLSFQAGQQLLALL